MLVWEWAAAPVSLLPNNEVHIDTWVKSEFSDLLDGGGGAVDVDHSLVDAHLEAVPGVGTVAARRTARRDNELLRGNADGSLHLIVESLGLGYDLGTGVLEGLHGSAPQGHSDSLDLLSDLFSLDLVFLGVHFQISKANFLINNKAF